MPRPKPTREERLEKRRLYERRRKERIRSNEVTREECLRKDRERYARKKAAGLIVSRDQMSPSKLKMVRSKNKISAAAYYQRKKNKAAAACADVDETIGNLLDGEPGQLLPNQSDEVNINCALRTSRHNITSSTERASRCNTLRRSLRLNSNNSISTNIQRERNTEASSSHRVHTSSPVLDYNYNNPVPSTSRQDVPSPSLKPTRHSVLRRCLRMNSESSLDSDIQHDADENVISSIHCVQTSGAQQITYPPNLSSIESTLCSNSPVSESSITSSEFKQGLKENFRKYERTKSKLITELQNKNRADGSPDEHDEMAWVDDQNSILFVKIVERFPDIYDNNTETYRRWCAHRAWAKVAECVKNEMKMTCTVDELKTRWKGIRSSYSRYLSKLNRSKQGHCQPPVKYYLSDELKFLIPYMKQKSAADNDTEEGPAFESCFTNEGDDSYSNNYEPNVWLEEEEKPDVTKIIDSPLSETEEEFRNNKSNSIRNKRKRTKSNDSEVENEDLQFFKSILPDIVNFTAKEKRRLKMGVLKLIDDIENDRD